MEICILTGLMLNLNDWGKGDEWCKICDGKKYSEGLELTSLEINRLNTVLSAGTQLKGCAANSRCHLMVDYIYQSGMPAVSYYPGEGIRQ